MNKFENVAEGSRRGMPVQEHGCRVGRFYTERSERNPTHGQYMFSGKSTTDCSMGVPFWFAHTTTRPIMSNRTLF